MKKITKIWIKNISASIFVIGLVLYLVVIINPNTAFLDNLQKYIFYGTAVISATIFSIFLGQNIKDILKARKN